MKWRKWLLDSMNGPIKNESENVVSLFRLLSPVVSFDNKLSMSAMTLIRSNFELQQSIKRNSPHEPSERLDKSLSHIAWSIQTACRWLCHTQSHPNDMDSTFCSRIRGLSPAHNDRKIIKYNNVCDAPISRLNRSNEWRSKTMKNKQWNDWNDRRKQKW